MGRGGFLQRARAAGLLLALFALTFKAFLPPGYMLSAEAGRQIVVTLCGGAEVTLDLSSGAPDHQPDRNALGEHCPFAFAAAPALTPPAASSAARSAFALIAAPAATREAHSETASAGPPLPPRGPPQHA